MTLAHAVGVKSCYGNDPQSTRYFKIQNTDALKFQDILQRYRSEAFAFGKHAIKKDELTQDALREILMTLIDFGCISQLGADTYKLKRHQEFSAEFGPVMTTTMDNLFKNQPQLLQMLTQQFVGTDQIMNLVAEDPNRYTASDLVLKISAANQIPQDRASAIVRRALTAGLLEEGADARVRLGKNKDLQSFIGPT
ncbi:hypothetical protein [Bradyrhizobium sp. SZCCHNS1054]|uniref:hypothetical protein n=1 Tax=Bradyrhizobium sp. SZCCHNS1054 TaxID=3057301 RepID=UPI002915DB9C|nr:hypothetical protein [Bradyrhizobium sp. SZCCHNS1054]